MINYAKDIGVKHIILIARFPLYLNGNGYDNGEGGVEKGKPFYVDTLNYRNRPASWDDPERIDRVAESYRAELELLSKEFNVIVFEPVPEVGFHVLNHFVKSAMFEHNYLDNITHSYESYKNRVSRFNTILDSLESPNLFRFDVSRTFCNDASNRCVTADDKGLFYRDSDHLSILGASLVVDDFFNNPPLDLFERQ